MVLAIADVCNLEYKARPTRFYELDDDDEHLSFFREIKEEPIPDKFIYLVMGKYSSKLILDLIRSWLWLQQAFLGAYTGS